MHAILHDFRYAIRQLRRRPGFALVCALTLALGVGANTAVFSVMNAILLRSLPVPEPSRIFYLRTSNPPRGTGTISSNETMSYPVYDALRRSSKAMEMITYVPLSSQKVAVRYGAQPEVASGDMASGNFFSALRVAIERGRGFTSADEAAHAPVAVISDAYWTSRFARNPDVLGQVFRVNGVPMTIIGVAAPGFSGMESGQQTDFWIPLQTRPELNAWGNPPEDGKTFIVDPTWWCMHLAGRLSPGVSPAQAVAAMQPVFQSAAYVGLGNPTPGEKRPVLSLTPARGFPGYESQYGEPLRVLMMLVVMVLLIALSNVGMMMMARNATRQREFSLRSALGAGHAQIFRQLLLESILLVAVGGALAWLFAVWATQALAAWVKIEQSLTPDRTVLLFTLGILSVSALLFGLAPLRDAFAASPVLAMRTSAATASASAGKTRVGKIVMTLQITLCVVLLVAGGLLVQTLRNLQRIPLGFQADGLVVFGLNPHVESLSQGRAFYQELIRRLRALPGVGSVTIMEERLGSWWSDNSDMMVDGKLPEVASGEPRTVRSNIAGPDFFRTLGVPMLSGRDFADSDTASSPHVGIINEEFARRFFPHQNPLGHQIGPDNGQYTMTVVGVAKNHKYRSIDEEPIPMAWYMYAQIPIIGRMQVELRVAGKPLAILPAAQKVIAQMDPNLPLLDPMEQRAQYEETISHQLLFARLAGFFAVLALLLVATGLYGTLSYRVSNRTMEIGVRMAVGARRGQVVWMVLRDNLTLVAIGIMIGVPSAILAARSLSSSLYGIAPDNATVLLAAVLIIAVVAMAASILPARRAANVDPLIALRSE